MSAPVCRICGSGELELRGRKRGDFIREQFTFHRCRACDFQWVEPFSGFAIYDDHYYRGEGPDPYVDYESEYRDYRQTHRRHEFADMARLAEKFLSSRLPDRPSVSTRSSLPATLYSPGPSPLRWLDFGCGAGGFLKFLRERATVGGRTLELSGHDVGSYADLLKQKDGFRIFDLDAIAREPAGTYDVISMIEVVEHLPDPVAALTQVARLLKPGGLLLLTTGNLDSPVARRQGIHYRYCAPEIHVSLFGPRSLAQLYARVGLQPHAVRYAGAVQFKVLKTLRHRPIAGALAAVALHLPPVVWLIDRMYGVSAMPCAVKP